MKTKIKSVLVVFTFILLSSSLAIAQPNRGQQGQHNGANFANIIPDLTTDQQTKIDEFKSDMQTNITPIKAELNIKQAELQALMASDASLNDKEAKLKEINDLQFKLRLERIKFHENVRGILTDTQKTKLDAWTINHHQNGGMHNQMGNNNCRRGNEQHRNQMRQNNNN